MEGRGHGEKLSRLKEQAIAALLSTRSIKQAAARIGVCRQTLARWLLQPGFAAEYRLAREKAARELLLELRRERTVEDHSRVSCR